MFLNNLVNDIAAHETILLFASMLLILLLLILVVYLMIRVGMMSSRYRAMMRGSEANDLEGMLIQHIKEVERIAATNARILEENELIRQFIRGSLVRVAAVRFRAFEDMGGDLSFARADSRSYIKPIKNGASDYPLTDEEKGVLKEAMAQPLPIQY